jgi:predicted dehydrogenase
MRDAAARSGKITALAHEFRYLPSVLAMRELIANRHLGALREIEITWFTQYLRASGDRKNSWYFERARGGGMTGAVLSHLIDLACHLAGRPPRRSEGFERTANPTRRSGNGTFSSNVADGAFALLDFGDGLVARLSTDATRPVESATIAIHGETRTVVAAGPNPTQATTYTIDDEETAELELRASPHAKLSAAPGAQRNLPAFVDLLDRFADALDGKPAELPTFDDGLLTQEVLAKIGYLPR